MRHSFAKKELCFLQLFKRFVRDSKNGKRLQPNGKRISKGTISNYSNTLNLLTAFSRNKLFILRIRSIRKLTVREIESERNYWKKFYKNFSEYLYDDLQCYDNYVGQCFKSVKTFFSYLNKELGITTGDFHRLFYIRKEEIAIFTLMPEELNFLIYDKSFEESLPRRLREAKDFFVFGCTVALRVSDLISLLKQNVRVINENYYLAVRSKKTATDSLIKLPRYAVEIILKYKKQKRKLLPDFNSSNLNNYIKQLVEKAGLTHEVYLTRERRGISVMQFHQGKPFRFCDVVSTHTMRRTAITTMLCLGMPEQLVRNISGHAPNSKEFYRYVLWAQTYQDQESEKVFEKLKLKKLNAH
jgi:site-specific recombinase XerD